MDEPVESSVRLEWIESNDSRVSDGEPRIAQKGHGGSISCALATYRLAQATAALLKGSKFDPCVCRPVMSSPKVCGTANGDDGESQQSDKRCQEEPQD